MRVAAVCVLATGFVSGQDAAKAGFEVASIKPEAGDCANGHGSPPEPGRLHVRCIAVVDLIQQAYGVFGNGPTAEPKEIQVLGAPGWVGSDLFDIDAKPAGQASLDQMYGPMLRSLLEERFQLKIHRETRQVPVYDLTVAAGGSKLRRTAEGSCVMLDLSHPPPPPRPGTPGPKGCGSSSIRTVAGRMTVDGIGITMKAFAGLTLSSRVNLKRAVIDKTGLQGQFDIHLEFAPVEGQTASDAPSLFTALQEQLGLKLADASGPVEVLVVDHVEKPSAN
jgi:uncharacterized protein (TIGR03435 family)